MTASTVAVPKAWHEQLVTGGRLVVPLRLSDEPDRAHAVTAFVKVADGFDSVAVTPGGFMPLRRADGEAFEPSTCSTPERPARKRTTDRPPPAPRPAMAGSRATPPPDPSEAREVPAARWPLRDVSREQMEKLRIVVRYTAEPPPTQWTFPRGDHWIGIEPAV